MEMLASVAGIQHDEDRCATVRHLEDHKMRTTLRLLTLLLVGGALALSTPAMAASSCPGKNAKKDQKGDKDEDEGFAPAASDCPGKNAKKDQKGDDDDEGE
jgi:ribosomal protein L12E/L44/L45/RPP1/RPP2